MIKNKRFTWSSAVLASIGISFLANCGPSTPQTAPELIRMHVSPSLQPWLQSAYDCARDGTSVLELTEEASSDIFLQIGEPAVLTLPAYQIDQVELLIAVHRDSSVQNLSRVEVENLFAGQGDPTIQVWVYSSQVDIQQIFDREVMKERPITSNARLAASPIYMKEAVSSDVQSAGILTRAWMSENTREIYSLGKFPVLAISRVKPEGETYRLIGCLQK